MFVTRSEFLEKVQHGESDAPEVKEVRFAAGVIRRPEQNDLARAE